jgi:hypothetical protein
MFSLDALIETSPAASPILREYYRVGVGRIVTDDQMQSPSFQATHPWSAVFISYVVRRAGAGSAFAYSAAHQTYVRAARQNRLSGNLANPFWAFRPTEVVPRVGDIVCASRAKSGATYDNIAEPRLLATHGDVVVEVRPGSIRVIGGNVKQTVGEKALRTQPDGRLDLTGKQRRIFAIVRCCHSRAEHRMPPGAPTREAGLRGRVRRVMNLLVHRYGYPPTGAAGLVGNLVAESQLLPNRIEGSRASTPMRAADFAGRVRDFTPEEVRRRDPQRRLGPRRPGVGIAQWTSRGRRDGLFAHVFRGRQVDAGIMLDLEAQVDYLVTELHQRYRSVNATLMSPGVSVNQASDVVLLRFEIPASVLNRPPTDPGVQEVLRRRRAAAAQALMAYRSEPGAAR